MKATYKVNPSLLIEVEGENQKELFKAVAGVTEVFTEKECGVCHKNNIIHRVRTVDDNDFYEMHCNDCHATLELGQHKGKGLNTLYPKRKAKDGSWLKDGGWAKYVAPPKDTV